MNLIVDAGNTFIKVAVFDGGLMLAYHRLELMDVTRIRNLVTDHESIRHGIISSVNGSPEQIIGALGMDIQWLIVDGSTPVPFANRYATPATLGLDRLAAVTAGSVMFQGKDLLIIDAGTAITYDFVNAAGEYHGGAISPGIRMRYNALHTFTGRLPLLETMEDPEVTGNSTAMSIHSGVMNAVIFEAEGFIHALRKKYPDLVIILTGGDHNYFDKQLKVKTFAAPNLVLEGLNFILNFNLDKK